MSDTPPRVFISYAQESPTLAQWVLCLANRLRNDGVDCRIDHYESFPPDGWRGWMNLQLRQARHVLVVCTTEYRRRFDNDTEDAPSPDIGRGVRWESQHITQRLYDSKFRNDARFVPVLPAGVSSHAVPDALKDYPSFHPDTDAGYEALLRVLTGQHHTPMPPLANAVRVLPPGTRSMATEPIASAATSSTATTATALAAIDNPYPGLQSFKPEQAAQYFGRDEDIARVAEHLLAQRLTCLVGRSGSGKSSLAAAGVLPWLRRRLPGLTYVRFTPQADPVTQLAEAIHRALPEQRSTLGGPRSQRLAGQLRANPADAIAGLRSAPDSPLLLLADQFEELFTQAAPAVAEAFLPVLDALQALPQLHLLLTLRSEFMHRLMLWLGGERFATSLQPLDAITQPSRLRALIEQPARKAGVPVQAELTDRLTTDLQSLRSLPLLALTLRRLFDQREPAQGLTLAAYQRIGGLAAAVVETGRELDAQIDTDRAWADAAERLFTHLVTVIDDLPTRRIAAVEPLRADSMTAALMDGLRGCGFLADTDDDHVELTHDALLWHWPRLKAWCERCGRHLALRRQAEQAAQDWLHSAQQSALRWGWERQKPALMALLALSVRAPLGDPEFRDEGIAAWRTLDGSLSEPLREFLHPEPLRLLDEVQVHDTAHQRREEIGLRLHQIGDPRSGVGLRPNGLPDIAWIPLGAGVLTLGTNPTDHVRIEAFEMARYPITWTQYRAFVDSSDGFCDPRWWQGLACDADHHSQPGALKWAFHNHPVIHVSWYDAMAFCRWLSERLSEPIRLPTEWEWQWAAKVESAGNYPWPGDWDPMRANSAEADIGRTTAVGLYPMGRSRWGLDDMVGNISEWCLNETVKREKDDWGDWNQETRPVCSSGWGFIGALQTVDIRVDLRPDARSDEVGFRVCRILSGHKPMQPPRRAQDLFG